MYRVTIWAFLLFNINVIFCDDDPFIYDSNQSVALLQKYIQINTTTYNDLGPAVEFWQKLASERGVTLNKYVYKEGMPVLVIKWPGQDPTLTSIMLNSHMDVVPASGESGWSYPPFSGHIADGKIYGRGSQDMKSVSIQYFEALTRLAEKKVTLKRDVYMTLMPDEEVGSVSGMDLFLKSADFKALNVGFELDEGGAVALPLLPVFYQDKSVWQIRVDCYGAGGHGSSFPPTKETAAGKCHNVATNLFDFRDQERLKSIKTLPNNAGAYTSLNLNIESGGTANNVVPEVISHIYDMRLDTSLNEDDFQRQLESMINAAGDNITITYIEKDPQSPATVANSSNPYWQAIKDAVQDMPVILTPAVAPGSTDARHVRAIGIPAFGVSYEVNNPTLLHSDNEHLRIDTFLQGIDFYEKVITNLANIPGEETIDSERFLYSTTSTKDKSLLSQVIDDLI